MDWQFAFERSEMLRLVQTGLLKSIGHELKTPLNGQAGALEMILGNLCDSPEEEREYITAARQAVDRSVAMVEEFSEIARYWLPLDELCPQATDLQPILEQVQRLTRLPARDRGIRYHWPQLDPEQKQKIWTDPAGLTQALWGLCHWGIGCLRYGSITVEVSPGEAGWCWDLEIQGSPLVSLDPDQLSDPALQIPWQVSIKLIRAMGGQIALDHHTEKHLRIRVLLPTDPAASPDAASTQSLPSSEGS